VVALIKGKALLRVYQEIIGCGFPVHDQDPPALDLDPALGIELDGSGIDLVLLPEDAFRQTVFGIAVKYRNHGLDDDRAGVHALVHEMHGAA